MYGLERDFIQQDGITMLLGKPEGLAASELNMVQARMLMNTGIPHHLRLLLREIDLQVTLEYAVTRRKMLGALLKSEKISMMEFFGLLLQIAAGMEEGRLYMLSAGQYALHEDYIFIEGPLGSGKVFLTYIPLQHTQPLLKPGESLKSLIMVFMASINELSGDGVQRLLQYCGEEEFSPVALKELLAELLTAGDSHRSYVEGGQSTSMDGAVRSGMHAPSPPEDRIVQEQRPFRFAAESVSVQSEKRNSTWDSGLASLQEASIPSPEQTPWMRNTPRLRVKEELPEEDLPEKIGQAAGGSSAYKTYFLLGGVLCTALLWKLLYLNNPGKLWLLVCTLATLGLAVLSWMVWSGRITWGTGEDENTAEMEEALDKISSAGPQRELEWDFGRKPEALLRSPAPVRLSSEHEPYTAATIPTGKTTNGQEQTRGTAESFFHGKEPAVAAATMLLSREPHSDKGSESQKPGRIIPYLERSDRDDGGAPERIELNRPSFIIGRSSEVAQFVEKSEGASRVHAEISRSSGGYILKDLDSRNGTLLAGEVMIPYKEYPLTEGTEFTIVKGCYTFHTA